MWANLGRQEEEMYRGLIASLEERQSQLVGENSELRQCLRFMQQELTATLTATARAAASPTSARTQLSDKNDDVTTELDDVSESDALSEGNNCVAHLLFVLAVYVVLVVLSAHYEMPFDVVRDDIQKTVKETVKQIQRRFAEKSDARGENLGRRLCHVL